MDRSSKSAPEQHICVGLLAHVDAGKTTLSEAMLYETGRLKRLGRVDHQDAFLDTHSLERARGITIFSKQARLQAGTLALTLLDTPGHVDFSAEMERTLQVLDYAILVISGTDGVQAHTETLWQLLRRYHIPTFLFLNKMDLAGASRDRLMGELKRQLSDGCIDFSQSPEIIAEEAALCSEEALEVYLRTGQVPQTELAALIARELLFPCFPGSALKLSGVQELLLGLERLAMPPAYPSEFAARVYQIGRDAQGNRLTYLKVTGGCLRVRAPLSYCLPSGERLEEKIKELRFYSGAKFETGTQAPAGCICAVLGLSQTHPGQSLGVEAGALPPLLEPVMAYRLRPPQGCDPAQLLPKLRQLEEEDPQLHIVWDSRLGEIRAQLMGQVQIEVLRSLVMERFDTAIEVEEGRILYKETIAAPVEGVGHFEPLRHYAEVHLLLEPLPQGSGLVFDSQCSEDVLERSWQRLILTHLREKTHLGVLTGAPITDMKITLAAGRAHLKHTEGGDFRQATYRALRQGLMQAQSILLEPYYHFRLSLPQAQVGRAIGDLRAMSASFSQEQAEELAVLTGSVPVSALGSYAMEVAAYTRGRGHLSCSPGGYAPCRNQEQIVAETGYDPEADLDNSPDSVFCAHGAGFPVKWQEVPAYMHLESCLRPPSPEAPPPRRGNLDDRELEAIMEREFGPIPHGEIKAAVEAAYGEYERHMKQIREKGAEIMAAARKEGRRIIVLAGRPYHVDPEVNHGIDTLITQFGAAVITEDSVSQLTDPFKTTVLNQWTYHARLYAAARYITTQRDMNLVQLVSFGCGVDAITTDEVREILEAKDKIYTQIKIDEITNLGAVRIRLRSLFAAIDQQQALAAQNERKD